MQNQKVAVHTTVFFPGKPVMIVTEYMENGSLDTFLKVGLKHVYDSKCCLYAACDVEVEFEPL